MSAEEAAPDAAPGALRGIEELVNTFSADTGTESLTDPATLAAWLAGRGLLPEDGAAAVDDEALRRTRVVREGLRALLADNNAPRTTGDTDGPAGDAAESDAAPPGPAATAELAAIARELPLILDPFADPPALVPHADGTVDAVLAGLLRDVAEAVASGAWPRMKACRECAWAYYDNSRNRSRSWCSMAVCGNRAKARAFRKRSK
ncbi:CGNR zinc finger domain-containing protein [Yinghuangia soli]|uniref:CGNR zinc finger domain-containing protein n=1 Tax=Yinghuangia soli TaxID=2908204 RepID=A0AA41Q0P0_9ACTN|nr:CGNR zinc finger domain-containing protein [Yinghuangia soli]MCF2529151.1 CGNR zinc finger domain-containing protein [Yinghuangia soli]